MVTAPQSGDWTAYITFLDPTECWACWSVAQGWWRERRDSDPNVTSDRPYYFLTVRFVDEHGKPRKYAPKDGMQQGYGNKVADEDIFPGWQPAYDQLKHLYPDS